MADHREVRGNIWLIRPELWSQQDHIDANTEGWSIYVGTEPGVSYIHALKQGDADGRKFFSDRQAAEHVMERMHQGSAFHRKAWIALMKAIIHGARE